MMECKKRCSNFTYDEVEVLIGLVELNRDIVESKKTDHLSCSDKDKKWKEIENHFNSSCGTGRSNKMLRSKWESLKKTTKKLHATVKCELYKTGGGPQSTVTLQGVHNRVMNIIGIGATGLISEFDSDAPIKEFTEESCEAATSSVVDVLEKGETPALEWASWNPNLLKTPVHKALSTSNKIDSEPAEIADPCSNETNKRSRKRKLTIREQLNKRRVPNSSVYEDLAKKKIQFIDFQMKILQEEAEKKERRLEEKHLIEMDILRAELKNKTNK